MSALPVDPLSPAPQSWPFDPPGYVFLARAAERLAPLIVDGWSSADRSVMVEKALAISELETPARVADILRRANNPLWLSAMQTRAPVPAPTVGSGRLQVPPRSIVHDTFPPAPRATASVADWKACYDAAKEVVDRVRPATLEADARRRAVGERIAREAASGVLVCCYRPKQGGPRAAMPAQWWEVDFWLERLVTCQLDPLRPYFPLGLKRDLAWIFVSESSVEALARRLEAERPAPAWAKRGVDEAYKVWLGRPEVMEEARRRAPGMSRATLAAALSEMDQASGGEGNAETIKKNLRDHGLWPEGYQ